jgi:hypothetical protein
MMDEPYKGTPTSAVRIERTRHPVLLGDVPADLLDAELAGIGPDLRALSTDIADVDDR